jgi:hypothetical protein
MDDKTYSQTYAKPRVIDYGGLQELTAACIGGAGGDSEVPGGVTFEGKGFGTSNPAAGCTSKP